MNKKDKNLVVPPLNTKRHPLQRMSKKLFLLSLQLEIRK